MKEPLFLEPLFPDRSSGENLAVQLARRLRDAIERRELAPGMRLLGTRQLASRLGLGRNTVALAFEELTAQGYLEARAGEFLRAHLA
ncbi:MAG: GntR family transcriptional regulator, partial [Candidatus Cybelea sp.]